LPLAFAAILEVVSSHLQGELQQHFLNGLEHDLGNAVSAGRDVAKIHHNHWFCYGRWFQYDHWFRYGRWFRAGHEIPLAARCTWKARTSSRPSRSGDRPEYREYRMNVTPLRGWRQIADRHVLDHATAQRVISAISHPINPVDSDSCAMH
jgi:hypothetical protein